MVCRTLLGIINRSEKSILQEKLESAKEYEAQGLVSPKNAKFGVDAGQCWPIGQIQCICWIWARFDIFCNLCLSCFKLGSKTLPKIDTWSKSTLYIWLFQQTTEASIWNDLFEILLHYFFIIWSLEKKYSLRLWWECLWYG